MPLTDLSLNRFRWKEGMYSSVCVCISGTVSMAKQVNSRTDTSNGDTGRQNRNVAVSCAHMKFTH